MGFGCVQQSFFHDHVHDQFQSAPFLFHVPAVNSYICGCPAHRGPLCIPDTPVGLQSTVDHSSLPGMGPIQCRTPDSWRGIFCVDPLCTSLVFVHFHNIVFLLETRTDFADHPCQIKKNARKLLISFS